MKSVSEGTEEEPRIFLLLGGKPKLDVYSATLIAMR
jgi:hypothetical protein